MHITELLVENFRNLDRAELKPGVRVNWLAGPNGAGKTSILEAIHALARGRSFRASTVGPMVRDGARAFRVFARTRDPDHRVGVERGASDWNGRIDGETCKRMSAFARCIPLVLIDPENHALVEGSPSLRRSFLDWGLFHVEQSYLEDWRRYSRLLRQRNAALRGGAADPMLDALDSPMAEAAERLDGSRNRYVERLSAEVRLLEDELRFELPSLELDYRQSCDSADGYRKQWRIARNRDREQGFTREGPQRAELAIRAGERMAAPRLSRGQMKLAALLLKLAQMRLGSREADKALLLLDDPVSELDETHLRRLFDWVADQPNQTWITAVETIPLATATMFHVEQGKIRAVV